MTATSKSSQTPLTPDNNAVLKHVAMYQDIIKRMAGNSSDCKKWCIALVTALLAFAAKDGNSSGILLAIIPILLFWFLDTCYLGLEKQFRAAFNEQMAQLRQGEMTVDDLFVVRADGSIPAAFVQAAGSWSTSPVYIVLFSMTLLIRCILG